MHKLEIRIKNRNNLVYHIQIYSMHGSININHNNLLITHLNISIFCGVQILGSSEKIVELNDGLICVIIYGYERNKNKLKFLLIYCGLELLLFVFVELLLFVFADECVCIWGVVIFNNIFFC
eukprot:86949_1